MPSGGGDATRAALTTGSHFRERVRDGTRLRPASIVSALEPGAFFGCAPDCRVHGGAQEGTALAVPAIVRAPHRGAPYTHIVELGIATAAPAGAGKRS